MTRSTATMNSLVFVLFALPFASGAHAAKCKFETKEADHVEARRVILFRGMSVGLMGYFGFNNGEYYLRGLFGSNLMGRARFTSETPLELTLSDGRTLTLDVVTEATASRLKIGHIFLASRDAQPVFSVTPEQWSALRDTPIVNLQMAFDVERERQIEDRKVKGKHARKIMAAIACVDRESATGVGEESTPGMTD